MPAIILLPHCNGTSASWLHLSTRQQQQPLNSEYSLVPKHILSQDVPIALLTRHLEHPTRRRKRHRRHVQLHAARALLPDLSNTIGGLFGKLNGNNAPPPSQSNSFISQDLQQRPISNNNPQGLLSPSPQQGDSRMLLGGHPNDTPYEPRPSPPPLPPLNASKSLPSPKPQATAIDSHPAAPNGTPLSVSTSSADASSATAQPVPSSVIQRFASYYHSGNHLQVLVIFITLGVGQSHFSSEQGRQCEADFALQWCVCVDTVMGVLVGLMAILKCVAHKKRFANKKDYPTGFPWVDSGTTTREAKRSSTRRGLVSATPTTCMSTRNSMVSSVHSSTGPRLHPERDSVSHAAEYQLNDLSPDAYDDYFWALSSSPLEKEPFSSSPGRGPSSASPDDNAPTPSTQGHEQWLVQPVHGGSYFVPTSKAKILDDSKVFTLGHDP
ncbi:uncharacterized protein VP01_1315g2 [Puccinia sorghi]|uniref:Uncharacterized protein n=1 Tax=Puccinia sorghi TaxID=27349 RepID=A0A0L6VPJ7_9BASI|nr:uncharacterized protein VP01_1315g2 [Puccinia sorghi]